MATGRSESPIFTSGTWCASALTVFEKATGPLAVYHVAGRGMTTVREIAEIVVTKMGLPDASIEYAGGKTGWLGDVPYFQYDSSKIRALGFEHTYNSTQAVRIAVQRILGKGNRT